MKIRKFNESYDEDSNRLDIDTLLNILLEISDELDCEVVLCTSNGICRYISGKYSDVDDRFKDFFKFAYNVNNDIIGWSFRVDYTISDFKFYPKLINVLSPVISRIDDLGWSVSEFGNSKGFRDTEVLLNCITFKFKPNF